MRTGEAPLTPLLFNPAEDGTDWAGHYAANDNLPRWVRLLPYLVPLGVIIGVTIGFGQNLFGHSETILTAEG